MTVCVAALAAKSQAIVMISDKALTYGPMVSDTSICKMAQIGQSPWHVLMSGNVAIAEEIAMQSALLLKNAPDNGNAGSTMMPLVGMAYRGVYKKHLIENVVTPKAVELTDEEYRECQAFVSAILSPPSPGAQGSWVMKEELIEPFKRSLVALCMMGRAEKFAILAESMPSD